MKTRTLCSLPLLVTALALSLASATAGADVKVDKARLAELQKVAVVGYSFWRDVELDSSGGPFALQKIKELKPEDPESVMMQGAAGRTMALLQKGGSFSVLPAEEVFANEEFQKQTKDPKTKWAANWFFPEGYRVISLKAKNAKALCAALGVDAVVQFEFNSSSSGSGFSVAVYSKMKQKASLKGEITMIDKDGKTVVSGSVTSDDELKSTTHAFGAVGGMGGSGVQIENKVDAPVGDDIFELMMQNYLGKLAASLGFE